jgi:hypothetical protein
LHLQLLQIRYDVFDRLAAESGIGHRRVGCREPIAQLLRVRLFANAVKAGAASVARASPPMSWHAAHQVCATVRPSPALPAARAALGKSKLTSVVMIHRCKMEAPSVASVRSRRDCRKIQRAAPNRRGHRQAPVLLFTRHRADPRKRPLERALIQVKSGFSSTA